MNTVITYWQGDKAEYTGKYELLHGALFFELLLLEGHRNGERVWTLKAPKD